jgi:hypothetical protein
MPPFQLSICIATYNRAETLRRTLEHLAAVSALDLEVVVADNCSPDHTSDVVKSFDGRFANLLYFRQPHNRGPMTNFGTAVNLATGDYVYTLSDDDRLLPAGVTAAVAMLAENRELVAVYGGYEEWDAESDQVLQTNRHVAEPQLFGAADKLKVLNAFESLWFPVARREVLQRYGEYDDQTWGLMRQVAQLLSCGSIMVIPDLFYRHAHTAERLEHELTEPWYHDHLRSDYELFLAEAVDQPDIAQVGHFIALRASRGYYHAIRIAKQKKQYLKARHYVLRAKAYGLFVGDALANWERDNLIHVSLDRLKQFLLGVPTVERLVYEECELAQRCITVTTEAFPELPESITISRAALLERPPSECEFLLPEQYETLEKRAASFGPDPSHQRALADLVTSCRVTHARD